MLRMEGWGRRREAVRHECVRACSARNAASVSFGFSSSNAGIPLVSHTSEWIWMQACASVHAGLSK